MTDNKDSPGRERGKTSLGRLEKLVGFASAALLWEKLWRAIIPPLLVLGLFVSLSFAGLWLNVSRPWRIIGVALFGLALIMAMLPVFGLRRPSRKQALARIDRSSGLMHNPASGLEDELANDGGDPATRALWAVHRRRMMQAVAALKVGTPSPRMVDFDRYALRAAVLVMLVASAFIAGPEKYARLAAAFDWREAALPGASYRIDAWIDPPAYTGKPPVMLNLAKDISLTRDIAAPINSTVIVRASGGDLSVETEGGLESSAKADAKKPMQTSTGDSEQRWLLHGDAKLSLKHAGALVGLFDIAVIPDLPPQIELTDAPRANARGSLTLSYKISDDYGAVSAQADFADPGVDGSSGRVRSLVPPPHLALPLPAGPVGLGETEATVDLSDHPWAGARVKMTLTAHDGGGNSGKSEPIEITLPQRPFVKPIARALVEQRRNLVLYPDSRERVEMALDGLMIAPEAFDVSSSVFLGLSVASSMLQDAQSDADLVSVADYLWNMALEIENGSLSEAERDLRAAEQQLRDALQRNAPDEEIRKLTENLRAAMDKFLNEFSEQQARELGNQQQAERAPNPNRSVSRKDLQSMLDRMQQMARSGDRSDAQRMLEQLQNTLENLQMARRRDADPTTRAMNQALRDLDKLTREQQQLRDETNRQAQAQEQAQEQRDESDDQQQGQPDQAGPQSPNDQAQSQSDQQSPMSEQELHDRQQALRNRLEEVERQLKQMGQDQSGLTEAQKAMKEAEKALSQDQNQGQQQGQNQGGQQQGQNQGGQGQGQSPGGQDQGGSQGGGDQAVAAQGRALEALRKGTEQLAQSMQKGGEGQGAEGDQQGDQEGAGQAEGGGDTDPLGRPLANDPAFDPHARFDPMGIPAAQRAQRVLEELRRRLSDPSRPQEELDYLERLLKPY